MNNKRTRNEKIAIAFSLLALLVFFPVFLTAFQAAPESPQNVGKAEPGTKDPYYVAPTAILNFASTDIIVGSGAAASAGDTVFVHYVGQLTDGTVFDSSTDSPEPFSVTLGGGSVITGWDLGLIGMREGGTRRLVIPPELGYNGQIIVNSEGETLIPANSTLIFDIVLLRVDTNSEF
jgi:hypothetical protein